MLRSLGAVLEGSCGEDTGGVRHGCEPTSQQVGTDHPQLQQEAAYQGGEKSACRPMYSAMTLQQHHDTVHPKGNELMQPGPGLRSATVLPDSLRPCHQQNNRFRLQISQSPSIKMLGFSEMPGSQPAPGDTGDRANTSVVSTPLSARTEDRKENLAAFLSRVDGAKS